jgi:hypothetical protein
MVDPDGCKLPSDSPYFLPWDAPSSRHRRLSRPKPRRQTGARVRIRPLSAKTKDSPFGLSFVFGGERGILADDASRLTAPRMLAHSRFRFSQIHLQNRKAILKDGFSVLADNPNFDTKQSSLQRHFFLRSAKHESIRVFTFF